MDELVKLAQDLPALQRLFFGGLGVAAITYFLSLAYFRGLFGQAAQVGPIPGWDGAIEGWLLGILGTLGSILTVLTGSVWITLLGLFLLIFVLYWLVIRLMFHDLPPWLAWLLTMLMIIAPFAAVIWFVWGAVINPLILVLAIALFLVVAVIAAIIALLITFLYKLLRAVARKAYEWFGPWIFGSTPGAPGTSVTGTGGVGNPTGILGGGTAPTVLAPESCITIDFGSSRIADHLNANDLRITMTPATAQVSVDVSNDNQNWESCGQDASAPADWDVPWWNSPWRYVRICNKGNTPVSISSVVDLD